MQLVPSNTRRAQRLGVLACLCFVACASGSDGSTEGDAGSDVAVDATTETALDASADAAGESGDAARDACIDGAACSPAACRRGTVRCSTGTCNDEGPLPAGTTCGVFAGSFVCNTTGECVPCAKGDPCVVEGSPCSAGALDCSAGKPTCVASGSSPKNTACGTNTICDAAGKCVDDVVTAGVTCGSGSKTGNSLCVDKGFAYSTAASGYWWFQCGGPLDCPGGFKGDGTSCPDFCGGVDCVGYPFCGRGYSVKTRSGDGTTSFRADDSGVGCAGYNPGWTVRLRCRF